MHRVISATDGHANKCPIPPRPDSSGISLFRRKQYVEQWRNELALSNLEASAERVLDRRVTALLRRVVATSMKLLLST